jgi:hypothetical protein
MAIVCLGWGSLIWCQKALPVRGEWQIDGPLLPIEFARESQDKRITLVVCNGVPPSRSLWVELNVPSLGLAKEVLAKREGVKPENIRHSIGCWSPDASSNHPCREEIGLWAASRGLEGVVWTALKPRIREEYRTPTEQEVVSHLAGLAGAKRDWSEEYIRLAPRQIITPYRTAIEQALGWTPKGLV